jgi:quercetin dioxygenase-like cupin family protein
MRVFSRIRSDSSRFIVNVRPATVRPATVIILALAFTLSACSSASPDRPQPSQSATATASSAPIVVDELGKGEQPGAVDVDVSGPNQVVFRKITIKPGAGTGLHCHDGQLIAVVEKGVFTHYAPIYPGGVHTYVAGDSLVEGAGYVHEGKNLGTTDVVLLVTYIIRKGDPLAETDLSKCDR